MHEYTQAVLKGIMDKSRYPEERNVDNCERFARLLYEKADSCKCGCNQKTFPKAVKNGKAVKKSLLTCFLSFERSGEIKEDFMDYVPLHDRFSAPFNLILSTEQRQAVIASAYGDGHLAYPHSDAKYPRIIWSMGPNFEHANYKKEFFSFIGSNIETKENPGYGTVWNRVVTACHPCLIDPIELVYRDGIKTVSDQAVSQFGETGWAWFYGDDGHLQSERYAHFHTEGYGEEGTQIFCDQLNLFMNFDRAKVKSYIGGSPKKQRFQFIVDGDGTRDFIQRVGAYMADGLEYKRALYSGQRRTRKN